MPRILRAMKSASPAAENWLRAAVDTIAERTLAQGDKLPLEALQTFFADTSASPRGRLVAYELIASADSELGNRLLEQSLEDPSLEVRYDAVQKALDNLDALTADEKKLRLQELFEAARDLDQLKTCKAALEEQGEEVDLAHQMGFVTRWQIIGPFDNTDQGGFEVAYGPEREIDFQSQYEGKEGNITWVAAPVTTDDELGMIDVAEALGPVKGAIAYAYHEFNAPEGGPAVVRYTSKNATKLWVNQQEVASNEVYHSGDAVDQYVVPIELKKGPNALLLKVCQNEQTEPWAQDWTFQLRMTDSLAGAIHEVDD